MIFSEIIGEEGLFCDGDWIEKKDQDENGNVRLIQLADLGVCIFKDKSKKYITEQTKENLKCTYLHKGDILIARLPEPLGRACIFPFEGKYITAVDISVLRIVNNNVNPKYIMYMINSPQFRQKIKKYESGTTRKRISRKNLDKIQFTLPDIDTQNSVVENIENLFSQVEEGVNIIEATEEKIGIYYQSVLNHCIGDDNKRTIESCISEMGQGWSPKCERISIENDEEWAVITTTAVQAGEFLFSENKKLPDILEPREKHELQVGDVLITRAGPRSRCGVCCMVKKTKKRLLNCDKVYRIKVNKDLIYPEYLEMVLNAPAFQKEIAFCKTGGSDSGVNLTQDRFLAIEIPVPDLKEQKRIMDIIEEKLSIYSNLDETITIISSQAEALKMSILKSVFEGRIA